MTASTTTATVTGIIMEKEFPADQTTNKSQPEQINHVRKEHQRKLAIVTT